MFCRGCRALRQSHAVADEQCREYPEDSGIPPHVIRAIHQPVQQQVQQQVQPIQVQQNGGKKKGKKYNIRFV